MMEQFPDQADVLAHAHATNGLSSMALALADATGESTSARR